MKKRTEQHEIGDDGVTLFQEALRKANKNSKLTAVFNEQAKNDYGVDGELQFFEGGNHTGNVFKVQIKSKKSLRFINNNTQISFKLDNNEIKFLYGLNVSSALIVCDTTNEEVFWHPILCDKVFLEAATSGELKKTTTLHLSLENKIVDGSLQSFYKYFTDMQNEILLRKSSLDNMSSFIEKSMKPSGFDLIIRDKESPLNPNAIMSIETEQYAYDYCPNKKYGEEGLPSAKTKLKFDTKSKSQAETYQKLQDILKGNIGEVSIPADNILSTQVSTGLPILDKTFSQSEGIVLSASNRLIKRPINVFLSNKKTEFIVKAEEWFNKGTIHVSSTNSEKQAFHVVAELNVGGDKVQSNMTIGLNHDLFDNYESIIRYLDFLLADDGVVFGVFALETGEKVKVAELSLPQDFKDGLRCIHNICRSFADIQERYDLIVPYKRFDKMSIKDEDEIKRAIELFEFKSVPIGCDIILTITMNEGVDMNGLVEGCAFMVSGGTCIPLLGTKLCTDKLRQDTKGIVSKIIKQDGDQYKILVKDVSMRLREI